MGLKRVDSKLLAINKASGPVVSVEALVRHTGPDGGGVVYVSDRYKCSLSEALYLSSRGTVRIIDEDASEVGPVALDQVKTKESAPVVEVAPEVVEIESKDEPSPEVAPKPKRGRPRKVR